MSNEIIVFKSVEVLGHEVNVYGTAEEPLFLAKDVAEWIEHSNPRMMVSTVDEEEKLKKPIPVNNTYGVSQIEEMWFLTEDGLYEVLMQSRKPIAKQFKVQVKRILKDIRHHGGYLTPQKIEEVLLNPDTIIKLAMELKQERVLRAELQEKIDKDRPKTEMGYAISETSNSITINQMAKILSQNGIDIGQKRFFAWLRDNDYLLSSMNERNLPAQRYVTNGIFSVCEKTFSKPNGETVSYFKTLITAKGQEYFINLFLGKKMVTLNE